MTVEGRFNTYTIKNSNNTKSHATNREKRPFAHNLIFLTPGCKAFFDQAKIPSDRVPIWPNIHSFRDLNRARTPNLPALLNRGRLYVLWIQNVWAHWKLKQRIPHNKHLTPHKRVYKDNNLEEWGILKLPLHFKSEIMTVTCQMKLAVSQEACHACVYFS